MSGDGDSNLSSFAEMVATAVTAPGRLAAVAGTGLLDTGPETGFDRLAALASRLLDTPFGFITVVDDRRSFWKACIGVDATDPAERQNQVEESFCQYVIGLGDELLVDDTRLDARTRDNPSIESMGVLAWAGVPLRAPGGEVLGTVCVVDVRPRAWTRADAELLHDLAAIASVEVHSRQSGMAATRAESLLNAVLNRAPIGFALVDGDLRYEMINSTMAAMNGRLAVEHIGRSISDLLPDVVDSVGPLIKGVLDTGEPVTSVVVSGTTDAEPGVERFWSTNFYRLDIGDDRPRAGLFVEDVTDRATAARRAVGLAEIAGRLAAAVTLDDVGAVIGDDLPRYLDAIGAVAGVVDQVDSSIALLGPSDIVAKIADNVSLDDDSGYVQAYRTNEIVLVSDRGQRSESYNNKVDLGWEASAAVPCRNATGAPVGVFVIGWDRQMSADEFPVAQLATFAGILGQALERIQIGNDRRQLIDVLQRTLLDPAPAADRFDLAVRYLPAASAIGFGGDWYEVIGLGEHRTAFVVGDVVGHDPTAAARMAEIRTVIRDLVKLGIELSGIFDQAEVLLSGYGRQTLATVAIAIVDTATDTMQVVRAGHLPVVVCDPSGAVVLEWGALRPPLGVGGRPLVVEDLHFGPGATLVAVTDGLIETRGSTIDDDLSALVGAVAALADVAVSDLADNLIDRFCPSTGWSDDVALIVARRHGSGT